MQFAVYCIVCFLVALHRTCGMLCTVVHVAFFVQERLRDNKPFNKYNRDTFYTQDQVSPTIHHC